jgi:hypothetical protein
LALLGTSRRRRECIAPASGRYRSLPCARPLASRRPAGRALGGHDKGMTRLGESALSQPLRSLQGLPLPGVLSAAQLDSFARGLAAQRASIAALQAQLAAFDEQLAALEAMVGPLAEWSKTWAQFERLVMNPRRDPEPEG